MQPGPIERLLFEDRVHAIKQPLDLVRNALRLRAWRRAFAAEKLSIEAKVREFAPEVARCGINKTGLRDSIPKQGCYGGARPQGIGGFRRAILFAFADCRRDRHRFSCGIILVHDFISISRTDDWNWTCRASSSRFRVLGPTSLDKPRPANGQICFCIWSASSSDEIGIGCRAEPGGTTRTAKAGSFATVRLRSLSRVCEYFL
jgi:hypothetical protein